jgi:hypothetical protein
LSGRDEEKVNMQPMSVSAFRGLIIGSAAAPILALTLAFFGWGPVGPALSQPIATLTSWFFSQTGLTLP